MFFCCEFKRASAAGNIYSPDNHGGRCSLNLVITGLRKVFRFSRPRLLAVGFCMPIGAGDICACITPRRVCTCFNHHHNCPNCGHHSLMCFRTSLEIAIREIQMFLAHDKETKYPLPLTTPAFYERRTVGPGRVLFVAADLVHQVL